MPPCAATVCDLVGKSFVTHLQGVAKIGQDSTTRIDDGCNGTSSIKTHCLIQCRTAVQTLIETGEGVLTLCSAHSH